MRIPGTFIYESLRRGLAQPQLRPWILTAVTVYLVSPIDLLPSFFPILGELDDVLLLSLLVRALVSLWLEDPLAALRKQVKAEDPGSLREQEQGGVIDISATTID